MATLEGKLDNEELAYSRLRELLSLLSFYDFEFYLIQRVDLQVATEVVSGIRAYLIDKYDSTFPKLNRASQGFCINFDSPETMAIPDMLFAFLGKLIRFNQVTNDMIGMPTQMQKYDSLAKVGATWNMDIRELYRFMEDSGYKLVGYI